MLPIILLAAKLVWDDPALDLPTRRILLSGAVALMFPPLYLVLIVATRLNLMAVAVLCLAWGLARRLRLGPESKRRPRRTSPQQRDNEHRQIETDDRPPSDLRKTERRMGPSPQSHQPLAPTLATISRRDLGISQRMRHRKTNARKGGGKKQESRVVVAKP